MSAKEYFRLVKFCGGLTIVKCNLTVLIFFEGINLSMQNLGIIMQKFCPTKKWIKTPFEFVNYLVIFIKEFTELNIFCHFS